MTWRKKGIVHSPRVKEFEAVGTVEDFKKMKEELFVVREQFESALAKCRRSRS